jgi:polyphosphate kinase 2 (PPK2 family)
LAKHAYQEQSRTLRKRLQEAQRSQRESRKPAIVLIAGVDGAGKGDSVNLLNTWLDAHWIITRAFDHSSDEEEKRPALWRYWRALPAGARQRSSCPRGTPSLSCSGSTRVRRHR